VKWLKEAAIPGGQMSRKEEERKERKLILAKE